MISENHFVALVMACFGTLFSFFQVLYIFYMKSIRDDVGEMKNDFRGIASNLAKHIDDHLKGRL